MFRLFNMSYTVIINVCVKTLVFSFYFTYKDTSVLTSFNSALPRVPLPRVWHYPNNPTIVLTVHVITCCLPSFVITCDNNLGVF